MNEETDNERRMRFLASHDAKRKPLSQEERKKIFDEIILPSLLTGDQPATNRTIVAVGSQPGGGKSTMVRALKDRFGGERTVSISVDDFFNELPGFNEARMKGVGWGGTLQHEEDTISEWGKMTADYVLENKTHLIIETCDDPQPFAEFYKAVGWKKAELYIIATDKDTSLTSMFSRAVRGFEKKNMANCALMNKASHDAHYAKWPKIAFEVEASGSFDKIGIATRDRGVCYENEMISSPGAAIQYSRPPEAHREIIKLNVGRFTQPRINQLKKDWKDVFQSPLASLRELKSYPLKQYQAGVMSRVESPGAQFRPNIILPKDRAAERHAYMTVLHEDLSLINDNLDLGKHSDRLLSAELKSYYDDAYIKTERTVSAGDRWRRNIDKSVSKQEARDVAPKQAHGSSGNSVVASDSGYGSSDSASKAVSRLEQSARPAQDAGGDPRPNKRPRAEDTRTQGLLEATQRKLVAEQVALAGPQAKRARTSYDERPRDGAGRA